MKQNRKRKWIIIAILLLVANTYFYPYSNLSLNKSYSYHADNVMVRGYLKELRDFKKVYKNDLKKNVFSEDVTTRVDYLLLMSEQEWLVKEEPSKMKRSKLKRLYEDMNILRESLMELESKENFSPETESYLTYAINRCSSIQKQIRYLLNSKNDSRYDLQTLYHNLHVGFMGCFGIFTSYYESAKREKVNS